MSIKRIDGKLFAEMVIQGANNLTKNVKFVDSLNVFPVPDGDTGTNMNLSITSGSKEVKEKPNSHVGKVGQSFAKGLLMGARGNSGVILSQLFRGFSKSIESKDTISTTDFALALEAGVETAYKAVMKPIEGTILTVARETAKKAVVIAKTHEEFIPFLEETIIEANASLNRTPDLLPVLKQVGVVDSGGQGLVLVYEGFLASLKGEEISLEGAEATLSLEELVEAEHRNVQSMLNTEDIVYGYCTEFMVRFEKDKLNKHPFDIDTFRKELSAWGDSLLVVADDEIVKVHIHAEYPGEVFNLGQRFGSFLKLKAENMREQHTNLLHEEVSNESPSKNVSTQSTEKQEFGIVTVAMGSGIKALFESIGATVVIEGGQTMNPSTEDIVKAIEQCNAENVIVLPNNGNIVMAAEQAASVAECNVAVVTSKTVPQGMAALLSFNPTATLDENKSGMQDALKTVKTGQITYAVRDTEIDGVEITKDHFMGILESKIVTTDANQLEAAKKLLQDMIDEDSEILTILYGQDVSNEEISKLVEFAEESFDHLEVEVHNGNQPLYSYIFSIE
ncbi:DAK2 domain-containing protein [Gottfriedia acidiceleris]|uniref:DAK2 domain-containing protein n=1 Tax=Gottfriedia acidiceleris TaxID=371036 RepID=A0ABY4JGX5_9BACI|nr:DAK2 domain-containing protein [Gottfriedia acidiceleris]UPM53067.1 DAK2 domain-containing protein [Gottfriedia acidiceleris]